MFLSGVTRDEAQEDKIKPEILSLIKLSLHVNGTACLTKRTLKVHICCAIDGLYA